MLALQIRRCGPAHDATPPITKTQFAAPFTATTRLAPVLRARAIKHSVCQTAENGARGSALTADRTALGRARRYPVTHG
jgi:hypothetical protein